MVDPGKIILEIIHHPIGHRLVHLGLEGIAKGLEETGITKELKKTGKEIINMVTGSKTCHACYGNGSIQNLCHTCKGTGQVTTCIFFSKTCDTCRGKRYLQKTCHICKGTGKIRC